MRRRGGTGIGRGEQEKVWWGWYERGTRGRGGEIKTTTTTTMTGTTRVKVGRWLPPKERRKVLKNEKYSI